MHAPRDCTFPCVPAWCRLTGWRFPQEKEQDGGGGGGVRDKAQTNHLLVPVHLRVRGWHARPVDSTHFMRIHDPPPLTPKPLLCRRHRPSTAAVAVASAATAASPAPAEDSLSISRVSPSSAASYHPLPALLVAASLPPPSTRPTHPPRRPRRRNPHPFAVTAAAITAAAAVAAASLLPARREDTLLVILRTSNFKYLSLKIKATMHKSVRSIITVSPKGTVPTLACTGETVAAAEGGAWAQPVATGRARTACLGQALLWVKG